MRSEDFHVVSSGMRNTEANEQRWPSHAVGRFAAGGTLGSLNEDVSISRQETFS